MKINKTALLIVGSGIATVLFLQPLAAQTTRNRTLEERVASLELQVSALNLQVQSLMGSSSISGSKRKYTGIGESWQISNIWPQNTTIVLANGTKWLIVPNDRSMLYKWKQKQVVVIGESNNRDFPYSLRNTERNEQIEVQYLGAS